MRTLPEIGLPANPFTFHTSRFTFHLSRFTFALALLALLLATAWTPAPQTRTAVVVGQVTNGTPGGPVPADTPVTLHIFSGMEETGRYTTTLAADGSFRFDDLATEAGEDFVARVVYQDVAYFSDPGTPEPGQAELSLPITIYETTEDPVAVLVTQLHIFVSVTRDRLQIGEHYLVSNEGDRTYVGVEDQETGRRATLTFTLPEGAEELRFDGPGLGERFMERGRGFTDTEPILPDPATVEVFFGYALPYQEGLRVERLFDVPVASVALVIPEEQGALEGTGLTPAGTLDTQMGQALSYTAGPLAAGEPLAFTLVTGPAGGQGSRGAEEQRSRKARETAIGLVTLAAAVVAVYLLWRYPAPGPLPTRARPLVEDIAALDADFEAERVSEKVYHQERRALKRQLRVLLREAEGQGSGGWRCQ